MLLEFGVLIVGEGRHKYGGEKGKKKSWDMDTELEF